MQPWRWIVMGVPVLTLYGWGNDSQAADSLIELETVAIEPGIAVPPSSSSELSDDLTEKIPSEAYLLNFAPPQVNSKRSDRKAREVGKTASQSLPGTGTAERSLLPVPNTPVPLTAKTVELPPAPLSTKVTALFEGDADSLVAHAVGNAEGTRTLTGKRTLAYYGHVDPGNQAWNQGTFSYQHEADSPEEADQKQLKQLKKQAQELYHLASMKGLHLTLEETLNGIDLANQAPTAALDRGYVDWLFKAKKIGLRGQEAILWARTRAFLDPDTDRWNAPGLGNSVHTITRDQTRRQQAIAQAIAAHSETGEREHSRVLEESTSQNVASLKSKPEAIDYILSMDLPEY